MKILFLIHSLGAGGAERVAVNLSNYWAGLGWDVALTTLTDKEEDFYALDPRVERIPLGVARSSTNPLTAIVNNVRSIMAVRRLLKRQSAEVSVGMMTSSNVYLALGGIGLRGCRIGVEHTHPPRWYLGPFWERLRWFSYAALHAVVALTKPTQLWLADNTRVKFTAVIPNPVPWPLPSERDGRSPHEVFQPARHTLLAVGRLVDEKGFDLLLHAFSRIAGELPQWDLVIVGDGPRRSALESQIGATGLRERAFLAGRVGNVGDWYQAADLYVMSSRVEGFPNTLIEAMACGLPAISFDCETGPADIIRNGIDGVLVPPGDVEALAAELQKLMQDEQLRLLMMTRAIEVRERLSLQRITAEWEALFKQVRNDTRRSAAHVSGLDRSREHGKQP